MSDARKQPKDPQRHSTYVPTEKKSTKAFHPTPMLDQLESGPWPSFVTGLKRLAHENNMMVDLLGQLEHSYKTRLGYWKGGTVSVFGYGGGIIPRFSEVASMFPESKEFHTLRVQPPAGNHYTTKLLRQLSDSWNKWGSGLIAFHGQTGNIMFIGSTSENTQHFFDEINEYGFDLGGAGPCVRTAMSCVGAARCEQSCANEHRIHRTDFAVIGTWRDDMQVDQQGVKAYVESHGRKYTIDNVIARCPTRALSLNDDDTLDVDNKSCVRCMHCINVMTKALKPGKDRGITLLIGGKRTLKIGDTMGTVIVPFMKMDTDEDYEKLRALAATVIDFWAENGLEHERCGEMIERIGLANFLEGIGVEVDPNMITHPRTSSYVRLDDWDQEAAKWVERQKQPVA
jgi:sulfite reductase alpha subunit